MADTLPQDPFVLMSYVNTKLRDFHPSLEDFCQTEGVDMQQLLHILQQSGFEYNPEQNKFW